MKKFLIVLLSLGLIAAFSMTASAADVKIGGSYYVVGVYDSNDQLVDTGLARSRAFFYQRVRLEPVFQIAEGLTFTARMDALERQWGNADWGSDATSSRRQTLATNPKIQENFEFERGYVTFKTAIGQFQVGYQSVGAWGTLFGDSEGTRSRILYITAAGPVTILALYEKAFEADTSTGFTGKVDADATYAAIAGIYGFKGGSAGLLYYYITANSGRLTVATPSRLKTNLLAPYVKAQFGPVYVESEVMYYFGKMNEYEAPYVGSDVDRSGWAAYLMAKTALGPATIGAQVGWSAGAGNDPLKNKAGYGAGSSWNPALILANDDLNTWKAGGNNCSPPGVTNSKNNILLYNIFGSFNPTPKVSVAAALTFAENDKLQRTGTVDFVSKKLGTEFDVTATYKIYDNLSYMVGAGYLWTGDAFKGTNSATVIGNDYLLMNKLTLSF